MNFFRRLRNYFRGRQPPSKWTVVEGPDGRRIYLDEEMVEHLKSTAPQPSQRSLDATLDRARVLRIIKGGVSGGRSLGTEMLFEGRDEATLQSLRQALRIVESPGGHCMCHGDPAIEFLDESSNRLAVIGVHHGRSIRWSAWKDDAVLVDGCGLLEWLAVRGVEYPLKDYQASQQARALTEAAWERWFSAMPPCLQPLLADQRQYIGMAQFVPSLTATPLTSQPKDLNQPVAIDAERFVRVKQALAEAYPDPVQRTRALFQWFGEGGGAWSGYAAYEQVAEYLLLDVSMEDVLRALQGPSAPQPLLKGGARFLAGWLFATRRGGELKSLPAELGQRLLECSLDTEDADKRARAEVAFRCHQA
jgi:hypothetical protein